MNPHECPATLKRCSNCDITKPDSDFYRKGKRKDGGVRYMAECIPCYLARTARSYQKRKESVLKRHSEYRSANKDRIAQYMRNYYQANRDEIIEKTKAYQGLPHRKEADRERHIKSYAINRDAKLAKNNAYNAQRRDVQREKAKERYAANPLYFVAKGGERRARRVQATPKWVDLNACQFFYAEAKALTEKTGVRHVVDHIIPLKGRGVRGLHVPWNLQVITQAENLRKSNRLES